MIPNLPKEHFLFTSESVTAGHPDKLCDYISDSILDACLAQDPESYVACETSVKNTLCMVFGEISTKANIVYEQVVRQAIKEVGYDDVAKGFDYKNAQIMVAIDTQSSEIAQCVHVEKKDEDIGAGDQGLMIGYASDETPQLMPLSHQLSCQLVAKISEIYQNRTLSWVRPDAKVQVTVEYKQVGLSLTPVRVHTILISCQHSPDVTNEQIAADLKEYVVKPIVPAKFLDENTIYHMNPSGKFITGGPHGDAGLTGRKIIVDTYGGWGGHGGGAFSGKDASKVDRSAAYAARWIAKSLVGNGFAKRCMVQLAYGIGVAKPISLHVDTYGTIADGYTEYELSQIVLEAFDLRPGMIIRELDLKRPIFKKTAHNGHFGRDDKDFTWEQVKDLSKYKK